MVKTKSRFIFLLLVILLVSVYGCGKKLSKGGLATGTEGITLNFLEGNPLDSYIVSSEEDEPILIILEVRNKGAYPQEEQQNILGQGQIYLSGFDPEIIKIEEKPRNLEREFLPGVSSFNPEGGFVTEEFKGTIESSEILVDKYEPTILATLCYPYVTKASPSVCIDPSPFDDKQKKVCRIGPTQLSSQGAPIAVTGIEQEASTTKMQFKIRIKNMGDGDVIKLNALEKCNPYGDKNVEKGEGLERNDFDRVELLRATVGFSELRCEPLDEGRFIRIFNGGGFVICSLEEADFKDITSAYTTPLNVELRYGYRSTVSKQISISKITSIS